MNLVKFASRRLKPVRPLRLDEPAEADWVISPPAHRPRRLWLVRTYLLCLCTIASLAIAYYFVIALPRHHKDLILLEREKYQSAQKQEREERERQAQIAREQRQAEEQRNQRAEERKRSDGQTETERQRQARLRCDTEASSAYWAYVKLNGTWNAEKSAYFADPHVWEQAEEYRKTTLDYCYKRHGLE